MCENLLMKNKIKETKRSRKNSPTKTNIQKQHSDGGTNNLKK